MDVQRWWIDCWCNFPWCGYGLCWFCTAAVPLIRNVILWILITGASMCVATSSMCVSALRLGLFFHRFPLTCHWFSPQVPSWSFVMHWFLLIRLRFSLLYRSLSNWSIVCPCSLIDVPCSSVDWQPFHFSLLSQRCLRLVWQFSLRFDRWASLLCWALLPLH